MPSNLIPEKQTPPVKQGRCDVSIVDKFTTSEWPKGSNINRYCRNRQRLTNLARPPMCSEWALGAGGRIARSGCLLQ